MRISMYIKFQILKDLIPLTKEDINNLSLGGYEFIINGKEVPFDWDAFCGNEENGIFEFETGYGFLFNDFEIADYFDEEYANIGLTKEDITAEFLASAEEIVEIHMNFDNEFDEEIDLGYNDDDEQYKINVMEIIFTDLATGNEYKVKQEVLDEYNKGEM